MPGIDAQHREWFAILNELDAAINDNRSAAQTAIALEAVLSYTRVHFEAEERLMITSDYPGYPEHKQAHDELVALFESLKDTGPLPGRPLIVMATLRAWIEDHILGMDQAYTPHLARYLKYR